LNEDLRVNIGNAAEKKDIKLNSVWGWEICPLGKCFAIVLFLLREAEHLVSKLEETEQIIWIQSD
jgi:hypothetical protein